MKALRVSATVAVMLAAAPLAAAEDVTVPPAALQPGARTALAAAAVDDLARTLLDIPAELSLGLWYAQAEGVVGTARLEQTGLFGTEGTGAIGGQIGEYHREVALAFTHPDPLGLGWRGATRFTSFESKPTRYQGGGYDVGGEQAMFQLGRTLAPGLDGWLGIGVVSATIGDGADLPQAVADDIARFGRRTREMPLYADLRYSTLDDVALPTSGVAASLSNELSIIGDIPHMRTRVTARQHVPIAARWSVSWRAEAGLGLGLGGEPFPVLRHFQAGGPGSVRGFAGGSLGATSPFVGGGGTARIGGNRLATGSAELSWDPARLDGLRLSLFGDVGNAWAEDEAVSLDDLRASVGISAAWATPVGALTLSLAAPVREQTGDRTQVLQVSIRAGF